MLVAGASFDSRYGENFGISSLYWKGMTVKHERK
jgi:hypothetical protein